MVSMTRADVFLANYIFSVICLDNVNLGSNISPKCICSLSSLTSTSKGIGGWMTLLIFL